MRLAQTDNQWRAQRLAGVPRPWRYKVERKHAAMLRDADKLPAGRGLVTRAIQQANGWLTDITSGMADLRLPVTLSDAELCEAATRLAKEAFTLAEIVPGMWAYGAANFCKINVCPLPVPVVGGIVELRARMGRFCTRYGIEPPKATISDQGAVARMTDSLWWRRKLRASQARELEKNAVALGLVHRRAEVYASNVTVERRAQQKARNERNLEAIEAVNTTTGDIFTLSELAARAVSNPAIRRGELMTRISGFDAVAQGLGHVAELWTATCPSRMHPKATAKDGAVLDNPKFDGTTPRQAQQYLGKVFARFRAAAARRGMGFYGFRIAEPHHDATPHWHILFFMAPEISPGRSLVSRLRALFRRYFLADSKGEAGARRRRVEFQRIDPSKGSAAGYVAKYIAKNVDGYQVQQDFEAGCDAVTASVRVEAWASAWGIRQFQQVGGPPVGVWRELRRVAEGAAGSETLEAARSAADAGNWRRYVEVQGGPVVARRDLPLRVAYTQPGQRYNAQEGRVYRANLTRYGEQAAAAVYGVMDVAAGRDVVSRVFKWELKGGKNASAVEGEQVRRMGCDGVFGVEVRAGFSPPWSPVNNCTRPAKRGEVVLHVLGGFLTFRGGGNVARQDDS